MHELNEAGDELGEFLIGRVAYKRLQALEMLHGV